MSNAANKAKFNHLIALFPDFPKPGIMFKDISPLLGDPKLREEAFDLMAQHYLDNKIEVDVVAGIDSRGFIFGTALAARLKVGFVMIRKPSKLPGEIITYDYSLEYGKNQLCVQVGAIKPNQKVVIVDDLLATGGSAGAAIYLVHQLQGKVVGACFAIELDGLGGRQKLAPVPVHSLLIYAADGSDLKQDANL